MKVECTVVAAPYKKDEVSEDGFVVVSRPNVPFFVAVVDGHRTANVSKERASNFSGLLASFLSAEFQKHCDPSRFAEMFEAASERVNANPNYRGIGAVVTCVAVVGDKLHLAQAGDCQLHVSAKSNKFGSGSRLLTRDHVGENQVEAERLQPFIKAGTHMLLMDTSGTGFMDSYLGLRLHFKEHGKWSYGSLQPTRGFGDHQFQPAFTHVPETRVFDLNEYEGQLFALCSDGGSKLVRKVFAMMRHDNEEDRSSLKYVTEQAELLKYKRRFNDDDLTIVFFQVS